MDLKALFQTPTAIGKYPYPTDLNLEKCEVGKANEEEKFSAIINELVKYTHSIICKYYKLGYKSIDPKFIEMASAILTKWNKVHLIHGFIAHTFVYWDQVLKREREFFIKNAGSIFADMPTSHVNSFSELFSLKDSKSQDGYLINEKEAEPFWQSFTAMVKVSIKFIHRIRKPKQTKTSDSVTNSYMNKYFNEIDLANLAVRWNVVLAF